MGYLEKEKLLVEADAFSNQPNAPRPLQPNPFSVNLYENIRRLKLDVQRIVPIHGLVATLADLQRAIGVEEGEEKSRPRNVVRLWDRFWRR